MYFCKNDYEFLNWYSYLCVTKRCDKVWSYVALYLRGLVLKQKITSSLRQLASTYPTVSRENSILGSIIALSVHKSTTSRWNLFHDLDRAMNKLHSDARKQAPPSDSVDTTYTLKERNPYDVHVYFSNQEQREEAMTLRQTMATNFSWMRFYEPKSRPLGSHPIPMWEADFGRYENRSKLREVCAFLLREHGSLSVLVHPHSMDGDYADHTCNALWYGEVLELQIRGWKKD